MLVRAIECNCDECYGPCQSGLLVQGYEVEEGHKTCTVCRKDRHSKKFEIQTKSLGGHIDPKTKKYTVDKIFQIRYKHHQFELCLWRGKLPQKDNSWLGVSKSQSIFYIWGKKWTCHFGYSYLHWRDLSPNKDAQEEDN